jgi:M-phase inducer tyrosine phosphatase
MFEHPADVMKTETKRDALESIMDVDEGGLKLPHVVPDDQPGGLPRISQETMVSVLGGEFNHLYDDVMVIDCRFEYEYNGGHINGAANFNDKEQLAQKLFAQTPGPLFAQPEVAKGTLIVLHCEYSVHRAPLM